MRIEDKINRMLREAHYKNRRSKTTFFNSLMEMFDEMEEYLKELAESHPIIKKKYKE